MSDPDQWHNAVYREIERLNECVVMLGRDLRDSDKQFSVAIAELKVKASAWGLLGGLISFLVTLGIGAMFWFLRK